MKQSSSDQNNPNNIFAMRKPKCLHVLNTGMCEWQTRYQLKIPNCKPCIQCTATTVFERDQEDTDVMSQYVPADIVNLFKTFVRRNTPFLPIGEFHDFSVYPYVGMQRHVANMLKGETCQNCQHSQDHLGKNWDLRCYCANAFTIKRHVLLETVTYAEWYTMLEIADKEGIFIYTHQLCTLPFTQQEADGISVYIPGTEWSKEEQFEEDVEKLNIFGLKIEMARPIISNLRGKLASFFTKKFMEKRTLRYGKEVVETTDSMIKFADSVVGTARFDTDQQIVNQIGRIETHVRDNISKKECLYRREVVQLHKMNYLSRKQLVQALVLYCAATTKQLMATTKDWMQSCDDGLIAQIFSTAPNHTVCETREMVVPVIGKKPAPKQSSGSFITVKTLPVAEDDSVSSHIEVGPQINGYHRIVPPTSSMANVICSIEARQNAEALPEKFIDPEKGIMIPEFDQTTVANLDKVVQELAKHCQYQIMELSEIPLLYEGAKRKRYQKALDNVRNSDMLNYPQKINKIRKAFIKLDTLYKGDPKLTFEENAKEIAHRIIQGVSDEATLVTMPLILPLSKKMVELPNTDSFLNKFHYTSGMDANAVGGLIHEALTSIQGPYWTVEVDFSLYDASERELCHEFELSVLKTCCVDATHEVYAAATHVIEAQEKTVGFFTDRKTDAVIQYGTRYTRKSGDSNTSQGNSVINIGATYNVYEQLGIFKDLQTCIILGDDNLSIFRGHWSDYPQHWKLGMVEAIVARYARMGLKAKVKVSEHIANVEFCNMIFAPVFTSQGEESLTLISKLGRWMQMFNGVKASSIKTSVGDFVYDNLYARRNTMQFYLGVTSFVNHLAQNPTKKVGAVAIDNYRFKTPKNVMRADLARFSEFTLQRYGYKVEDLVTDENLLKPGNVHVPWFDRVAKIDL